MMKNIFTAMTALTAVIAFCLFSPEEQKSLTKIFQQQFIAEK
jgi:hypothetical protein